MTSKIVNVAILGQGRSGYGIHAKWLREAKEQYRIVAIADLLPERHEAAAEFGAASFVTHADLLKEKRSDIDLIVNALPSHLHPQATIVALNAGYNVLCEKPAAVKLIDFDAMVAAAERAGRHLFVFQNSRFQPAFIKIQELLASGKLGELVNARICFNNFARRWDWQASQDFSGGNLNNTGPHPVDQAVMLFGDRTPQVFSKLVSKNAFGDADNFASVILHGEDAPTIEVTVSSLTAYPQGDMYNLSCTQGGISGNLNTLKWKYFDPAEAPARQSRATEWSEKRTYNGEKLAWIEETWTAPAGDNFQMISKALYDDLYGVLCHGATPTVKLEQVRRQVEILEQVHRKNPLARVSELQANAV